MSPTAVELPCSM